jgi:predicted secreted Zn-dependent protease
MRRTAWACFILFGCAAFAGEAAAGVKVSEKTKTYQIAGKTGEALLSAMDRRGPKHGFLTRAIAQTRYSVSWTIEWGETRTACRVRRVDGALDITYTFPAARNLSPALDRLWDRFLAGVKKHESAHGAMARQMAKAVEKSIAGVSVNGDRGCRKARSTVKQRMTAIYAEYETGQIRFDSQEHREGGKVEALIEALLRK